jgi:hypothetical protein
VVIHRAGCHDRGCSYALRDCRSATCAPALLGITSTTVEIFHRGTRVASHAFWAVRNRQTTIAEHMPSAHQRYAECTSARLITRGIDRSPPIIYATQILGTAIFSKRWGEATALDG